MRPALFLFLLVPLCALASCQSPPGFGDIPPGNDLQDTRNLPTKTEGQPLILDTDVETSDIDYMVWETRGGGDCRFSITPQGQEFKIHLVRYQGVGQNFDVILSDLDGSAYRVVQSIFAGTRNLQTDTIGIDPGEPRGTRTTITLVGSDGKSNKIPNISPTSDLRSIYQFVTTRAKR